MQDIAAMPIPSPSFSTYSGHLAGVLRESDGDLEFSSRLRRDDDGGYSFHFVSQAYDDKDLPSPRMFPMFGPIQDVDSNHDEKLAAIGDQLRSLFVDDERDPLSSSDEEVEEAAALEGVASGNLCVWSPKRRAGSESSTTWCRKSRSTGSTTNWFRLRDLILRRSNSDGKAKLLSSLPSHSMMKEKRGQMMAVEKKRATKKVSSAQEVFYMRTKALKEEERRKTYLPYRRDLIGIFH